jgi:chitinase
LKSNLLFLALALSCLFRPVLGQPKDMPLAFRIVGYLSWKAAATLDPATVPLDRLTHVNLWFINPDSLGNFSQDFAALAPFIQAAHEKQVRVLISIGGGSRQDQYHRLLQDDQRPALVANLVSIVRQHQLDGVDVDLEGSNIDANYEKFVVELAAALRAHNKLLTAAIAVYYKDQLTDTALAQFDFVNVMSYDRTGPWRPEKPGPHATYAHAKEDLKYFGRERAIPKEKMTLGVPFYGYGFGPELNSPASSMDYKAIVATFPGAQSTDQWKMPNGQTMYYNGLRTIRRKTALARRKASGVMIWQLLGDASGPYSLLETIYDTAHPTKKSGE